MTPTVVAIFETEQSIADAADPLWRSDSTAAMAPVNLMGPPGYPPDRYNQAIAEAAEHLRSLPAEKGLRWLNLGGWFGKYEFGQTQWGGKFYSQPWNPDPAPLLAVSAHIAELLGKSRVADLDGIFIDNEGRAIRADGQVEKYEQSSRMAFLRRAVAPLSSLYDCPVVNYACADPPRGARTTAWWDANTPLPRGTIDGTSSVDCYSTDNIAQWWSRKRENVAACLRSGPTIPHGPALIYHRGRQIATPEEAARDTYDAILADSARGVRTHFIATYMWHVPTSIKPTPDGRPSREHLPLLADTVKRAVASASRLF